MEGCILFKGGRDVTEPLAFVKIIEETRSEGVYISLLGLYSAGMKITGGRTEEAAPMES